VDEDIVSDASSDDDNDDEEDETWAGEWKDQMDYQEFKIRPDVVMDAAKAFDAAKTGRSNEEKYRDKKPVEVFLVMIMPFVAWCVACFNKKIEQENNKQKEINIGEFLTFIGIKLFMSLVKLANTRSYWFPGELEKLGLQLPPLIKFMSHTRYQQITANLRFEDYSIPRDQHADKAWKVRTIFNYLKKAVRHCMQAPSKWLSFDEAMLMFTGRNPIRRVLPNKPIPMGFKFWVLVDRLTKLICDINIDDGILNAENCRHLEWGFTGEIVLQQITHLPGKWYCIVADNLFSSMPLAQELLRREMYYMGTMRKNKVPAFAKFRGKTPRPTRENPRGTVITAVNATNSLHLITLMDNAAVTFIDSHSGQSRLSNVTRRTDQGDKTFSCPEVVSLYNRNMNGVDLMDQCRTGFYSFEGSRRINKWTVRFFWGMLGFFTTQAFHVWQALYPDGTENYMSHQQFFTALCFDLVDNTYNKGPEARGPQGPQPAAPINGKMHMHTLVQCIPGSRGADRSRRLRFKCVYCTVTKTDNRTSYYCEECCQPLHPEYCFSDYHTSTTQHTRYEHAELREYMDNL